MSTSEWDIVVVGGGPAGSATAARLASMGRRVLLLDRAEFPRRKPCGESVNPGAVRELEQLGVLPRILELAHERIDGWRLHAQDGRFFAGRFPQDAWGLGIDRQHFDAALLQNARDVGVVVRTGTKVTDLLRGRGGVEGVRAAEDDDIRAKFVVGADGLRSVVVRRLSLLQRGPRLRKVALTAHLDQAAFPGPFGELHMRSFGCVGVARVGPTSVNVVVVLNDAGPELAGDAESRFDEAVRTVQGLSGGERREDVLATGPFDWPTRSIVADSALLVGDAAGYYDPFTGQGIYRALRGARFAAGAIDACLRTGDCSRAALMDYEREHRRAFGPGRRLQHLIEAVTSRPMLLGAFGRVARRWPSVAERLFGVTGDLAPLGSLFIPPSNH